MLRVQFLGGRYRLVERLGVGGMSVVWRAYDEVLSRPVAVKVLATKFAADAAFRARIRSEAQAAAVLSHPNITSVYDYGESENADGRRVPFVVMELVHGPSLSRRLAAGPLPWRTALRIGAQVAAALAAAHARGLVHRDVKPANVMLTANGVKVVDFGIAAVAGESSDHGPDGSVLGTPAYLAPERLAGGPVEPASDVYALGVLLFRALTGVLPWRADTTTQMISAHRYVQPRRLPPIDGLPPEVADLCLRCLAKSPADRPTSRHVARVLAKAAGSGRLDEEADAAQDVPAQPLVHRSRSDALAAAQAKAAQAKAALAKGGPAKAAPAGALAKAAPAAALAKDAPTAALPNDAPAEDAPGAVDIAAVAVTAVEVATVRPASPVGLAGRSPGPGRSPGAGRSPGPGRSPDSGRSSGPGRSADPGRSSGPGRSPGARRSPGAVGESSVAVGLDDDAAESDTALVPRPGKARSRRRLARHARFIVSVCAAAGAAVALALMATNCGAMPGVTGDGPAAAAADGNAAAGVAPQSCQVRYQTRNDMDGSFAVDLTIGNGGPAALHGWNLEFSFPGDQQITSVLSAGWSQTGASVVLRDEGGNAYLQPGSAVVVAIAGTYQSGNPLPTVFTLRGTGCSYVLIGATGVTLGTGGPPGTYGGGQPVPGDGLPNVGPPTAAPPPTTGPPPTTEPSPTTEPPGPTDPATGPPRTHPPKKTRTPGPRNSLLAD